MDYIKAPKMVITNRAQNTEHIHLTMLNIPSTQIKSCKKIVMVYQLKYKNGGIYGFGDFIRGCFALIHICQQIGLDFDIDLSNHPLSTYVEGHIKNLEINYNNISNLDLTNNTVNIHILSTIPKLFYKTFKNFIQNVKYEVYYTSSNLFPLFHIKQ